MDANWNGCKLEKSDWYKEVEVCVGYFIFLYAGVSPLTLPSPLGGERVPEKNCEWARV